MYHENLTMKKGIIKVDVNVIVVNECDCIVAMEMAVGVLEKNPFEYGDDGVFMGKMFALNDAVVVVIVIGYVDIAWNEKSTIVRSIVRAVEVKRINVFYYDLFMMSCQHQQ